jgi:hypothetical protein
LQKINLLVKQAIFFFLLLSLPAFLLAQSKDSTRQKIDTYQISDPLLQIKPFDTTITVTDTTFRAYKDTVSALQFSASKLLNTTGIPVSLAVKERKAENEDGIFYLLAAMVLLLAFLKFFYDRYFANLFRVFFNTSLRQSQLTDQLLQAKLPSLLFNLFFVISGGLYVYFLLMHYGWLNGYNRWLVIVCCIATTGLIYFTKFCTLKFTGWLTSHSEATNIYIFIVFLINKIIGIFLVPLTIIVAFSTPAIVQGAVIVSLLCVGAMLLMRFLRSYGLLQNQLKISRLHFFLYIAGVEIIPLLLIYKALVILLNKNL